MVSAKKKEKGMVEIESTQNLRRPVYVSLADQFVEDKKKRKKSGCVKKHTRITVCGACLTRSSTQC